MPVARHLLQPTRERGDAPLVRLAPHRLSYLALPQVELARFTRSVAEAADRLVSVALVLAFRRTGVTRYHPPNL